MGRGICKGRGGGGSAETILVRRARRERAASYRGFPPSWTCQHSTWRHSGVARGRRVPNGRCVTRRQRVELSPGLPAPAAVPLAYDPTGQPRVEDTTATEGRRGDGQATRASLAAHGESLVVRRARRQQTHPAALGHRERGKHQACKAMVGFLTRATADESVVPRAL